MSAYLHHSAGFQKEPETKIAMGTLFLEKHTQMSTPKDTNSKSRSDSTKANWEANELISIIYRAWVRHYLRHVSDFKVAILKCLSLARG